MLFTTYLAFSQKPPCNENATMLSYFTTHVIKFPELRTNMPEEVIKAYVRYDSLRKFPDNVLRGIIFHLGFGPEYYSLLKDYYILYDWDPILFDRNNNYNDSLRYYFKPYSIIEDYIDKKSPNKFIEKNLVASSHILHIKVTDTIRRYAVSSEQYGGLITAEILDTLKGKVIPGYKDLSLPINSDGFIVQYPESSAVKPSYTIQFDYLFDHWVNGKMISFTQLDGTQWFHKDKEYIVFLSVFNVCGISTKNVRFYSLSPWNFDSHYYLMYEIKDGILIDDYNEFGFGKNIPVEEWKAKFRKLVQSYLDGKPVNVDENILNIAKDKFLILPNPASDFITINLPSIIPTLKRGVEGKALIEIYDVMGMKIQSTPFNLTPALSEEERARIDISNLTPGVYFVKIGDRVEKFVKY